MRQRRAALHCSTCGSIFFVCRSIYATPVSDSCNPTNPYWPVLITPTHPRRFSPRSSSTRYTSRRLAKELGGPTTYAARGPPRPQWSTSTVLFLSLHHIIILCALRATTASAITFSSIPRTLSCATRPSTPCSMPRYSASRSSRFARSFKSSRTSPPIAFLTFPRSSSCFDSM